MSSHPSVRPSVHPAVPSICPTLSLSWKLMSQFSLSQISSCFDSRQSAIVPPKGQKNWFLLKYEVVNLSFLVLSCRLRQMWNTAFVDHFPMASPWVFHSAVAKKLTPQVVSAVVCTMAVIATATPWFLVVPWQVGHGLQDPEIFTMVNHQSSGQPKFEIKND